MESIPNGFRRCWRFLRDLCVDTQEPIGDENSLRQVIVNTHSPAVVGLVDDNDLLVAEPKEIIMDGERCRSKFLLA